MQQELRSSVWLLTQNSQFFLVIKLLLRCLGLLSVGLIQLLPNQVEASVIVGLEPEKLIILSEQEKQNFHHTSAETVTTEQGQPRLKLKLKDAVVLALQNNRVLKNAYLDRIIEQSNLEEAQDKFVPDFIPQVNVSFSREQLGSLSNNSGELELGAGISVRISTGGELRANWTGGGVTSSQGSLGQNFSVSFNQPLLRGFGTNINKASISIARLEEQQNLFQLKSTLIDTITRAVIDYRSLVQAQEELKIQQQALSSAKRQLEITQAFIDAGRLARIDLIQNQTAVANREVDVLGAKNRLQEAQLQLLQTLDLEQNLELVALETPKVEQSTLPSPNELLKLALANNPNYLSTSLNIKIAQLNLSLAEDDKRWDLSLNLSYDNNLNSISEDSSEFSGSLNLNREFFGDLRLEREALRSQMALQQAQNNVEEARATLEIEVQNSIREVNFRLTEVEQARRATQLSRQQLENEREKLRLGRGSLIDAIRFEDDLVNAANRELNAVIAYLNALTRLEQTIGTTLATWNVKVEGQ